MNTKKLLLGVAIGAAFLVAAPMASACALTAWTSTNGTPLAAEPDDAIPVARYAGRCAMQADAIADYVVDGTPAGEQAFNAQLYYYTGDRAGGSANIYEARSASGATNLPIRVQHDGTSLIFSTNGSATTRTVAVTDNKWYQIRLQWVAGAGTGSLGITVTGAGSDTPLSSPAITGVTNGSDTIEEVRMGLVSGAGTGAVNFDAYDSRRTTVPVRLCRGDANGDAAYGSADRIQMTNEILGTSLAPGNPDANEDGAMGSADRILVTNLILAGATCPTT